MQVTKGLVIADPWIGYILDGSKTWEMRSSETSVRGPFALIRKGTGAVWGVATLANVGWALTPEEMLETVNKHRIPAEMIPIRRGREMERAVDSFGCAVLGVAYSLRSSERRRNMGQSCRKRFASDCRAVERGNQGGGSSRGVGNDRFEGVGAAGEPR